MKMKPRYIVALAIIILLALIYIGCEQPPEPVSQEDRADRFETDLNNDAERDNIWENLHPSIQNAWKSPTPWELGKFSYS